MKMLGKNFQAILLFSFILYAVPCYSLPLKTQGRWLVDERTGERVKLHCANWPAHVFPMLAEGLDKQPLPFIASEIVKNNYNCIRFTFSIHMFTRYANLTIEESFDRLNLKKAKAGVIKHNPFVLKMTVPQAYEAVVDVLGSYGIMIDADNHISEPIWCCSNDDENGFPNDPHFDPEEWIEGLKLVAQRFKGKSQLISIGLRNEPRGKNQNATLWFDHYIMEAAAQVHQANPDVLVIASGLNFATDLTYFKKHSLKSNFDNKLIFEGHSYSWGGKGNPWVDGSVNKACADKIGSLNNNLAFVTDGENAVPLFFSEFGIDRKQMPADDDRFLSCFSTWAAEKDLDWGLWALQGSYYLRQNVTNMEEYFGVLEIDWDRVKNPKVERRLGLLKQTLLDPKSTAPLNYIMYHPQSGACVGEGMDGQIRAGNCKGLTRWTHNGHEGPLELKRTGLCLKAIGDGLPPILTPDCSQTTWKPISASKLHLASKDHRGEYLCLHLEPPFAGNIVTKKCICVGDDPTCKDNPTSQWFKLVETNIEN